MGLNITIKTDNKNLINIKNNYDTKTDRWIQLCNEYNVKFEFIAGKENYIADYLSRSPSDLHLNNIKHLSSVNKETFSKKEIKDIHKQYGHPGTTTLYNTLNTYYHTTKRINFNDVYEVVKQCTECQINKNHKHKYGTIQGHISTSIPLTDISSDVFGPIDVSEFNHSFQTDKVFIFTFTDRFSRFSRLFVSKGISSKDLIKAFKEVWLNRFPTPKTFLSDQGKCYKGNEFAYFCNKNKIKQIFTSIYNPTGNSISERINSIILSCLRIYDTGSLKNVIKTIEILLIAS